MSQAYCQRLCTAERQSGNCAMITIGVDAESRLRQRHHIFEEVPRKTFALLLVLRGISAVPAGGPHERVSEWHDDDHRFDLSISQEVIQDDVRPAVLSPGGLNVVGPVEQI